MSITEPTAPSAQADLSRGALSDATRATLDITLSELEVGEKAWSHLTLDQRAELLDEVHATVAANTARWAKDASAIKGLDPRSQSVGEEWISGPYPVMTSLATLAHSLRAIAAGKSPLEGKRLGRAPGNRVSIPVLPGNAFEAVLLHGFRAEVWMAPGVTADATTNGAGLGALDPTATDGIGLVLGAGNITSIPPLDVLYELIAGNRVVILKLNPVMDGMRDVYERALAPLIARGVLRIVSGGGDVGGYLAQHPSVSHVHMTGSGATHDVVVWGAGVEGRKNKTAGTPKLTKPMTSELGGVSPIIVVPGEWSQADLTYQAEHVATMRLHNGGYNCIAGQIVVLSSDWKQKDDFVKALGSALDRTPGRTAWYPGSDDRLEQAAAAYPGAERFGVGGTRLLVDIRADADASTIESTEYFSPVLGIVEVAGTGTAFLTSAIDTVNDDFLGTLGANVLIDPKTKRRLGASFREAIANLRYGTIAINAWTGVGYLTAAAPWGAFPGHSLEDVQSGIGTVHNALLLDSPERTVITGPFRPFPRSFAGGEFALFPKPPWFVTSRSALTTGKRLTAFVAKPSWLRMPAVFAAAFRA